MSFNSKKIIKEGVFHPDYDYDVIILLVRNLYELNIIRQMLSEKFDINENIISNNRIENEPYYIKIIKSGFSGFDYRYDTMRYFEKSLKDNPVKYEKLFTIRDIENGVIDNILSKGKGIVKPNYEPKKSIRLYESSEKDYGFLIFKLFNHKEFDTVSNFLKSKDYSQHDRDLNKTYSLDDFPIYIIVDKYNLIYAVAEWSKDWTDDDIKDYMDDVNKGSNVLVLNKMLTYDKIYQIDNLFKGIISPSYKPKIINKFESFLTENKKI